MVEDTDTDAEHIRRRRKIVDEVEKRMEKLNDTNGISTLGTFKSDEEIRGFIRKKRMRKQ